MTNVDKVKHHLDTTSKMLIARGNGDEVLEDAILDELDEIWNTLSEDELCAVRLLEILAASKEEMKFFDIKIQEYENGLTVLRSEKYYLEEKIKLWEIELASLGVTYDNTLREAK